MSDDNAAILPVIARAACSAVWGGKIYCREGKDETCRWREEYAVEIMDAIDAAGFAVVPKEPTQAMAQAALGLETRGNKGEAEQNADADRA
jgi:hypothetical protein